MGRIRTALRRYTLLGVVLAISISLTLVTFLLARNWEAGRAHSAFRGIASDRVKAIEEEIKDEALKLEYLKSFYIANLKERDDILKFSSEFQSLAREAFLTDSEIDLLAYAPRVRDSERERFVGTLRSGGQADYQISAQDSSTDYGKAPSRSFYYPITALEPQARYPMMMGFDLWSDAVLRQTLQESDAAQTPVTSAPIVLTESSGEKRAIWMTIPLSASTGSAPAVGYVVMRLRVDRLIENALSGLNPTGIDLFVYDRPVKGAETLIYTHQSRTRERSVPVTSADPQEEVPYQWSKTLDLGQREWRILARPAPAFIRAHTYWLSWIILGGGLLSTALLAVFVFSSLRRADRVEAIVARRTAELSEAVANHKNTEESLKLAHADLTRRVEIIHRRTREIELLSEMGDLLQTCRSTAEAYEVVAKYAQQLFPSSRGELYAYDEDHRLLDRVAYWGTLPVEKSDILSDECWALRRGKAHVVQGTDRNLICDHVTLAADEAAYICLPLVALGETVGLLHLRELQQVGVDSGRGGDGGALSAGPFDESRQRLVSATGEHAAMAFANLTLRESLRQQSIRDPLTGLFNRRYMEESLERELHRSRRSGAPLSVVMVDIDHFKQFNDTYGHEAGDVVLKAVGELLLHFVRAEDIPCRFGGEELVLILPGASIENGAQKAESFRRATESLRVEYAGRHLPEITISLGVAAFSEHLSQSTPLLNAADAALYRAKKAGRNRVETEAAAGSAVDGSHVDIGPER
ncbi:sensor domain-containing diguanylate cyclase [Salinispira pacifica]